MSDVSPPPIRSSQEGGIEAERDVRAGRDIAGRDINTWIGLGGNALLRLVLAVGLLVFFSTACSFTVGAVTMVGILNLFDSPVSLNQEAANLMAMKLEGLTQLSPGESFDIAFSEVEINSYFHYRLAGELGIENGQARLIGDDRLALMGNLESLGGQQVVAVFEIERGETRPLDLDSAAIQVVETNSSFGWASLPTLALSSLENQANDAFQGSFAIQEIETVSDALPEAPGEQPGWFLSGVGVAVP